MRRVKFIFIFIFAVNFSYSKEKIDSLSFEEEIKALDKIWREEMYGSLFDDSVLDCEGDCGDIDYDVNDSVVKYVLDSLNSNTPFNLDYNRYVKDIIRLYVRRHKLVARNIGLSKYYFPMFEEVFDKYDIPLEMKYLAVIESALNPKARSRVGASGIWQFMYSTGKVYNLKVSSYVDERFDPMKATEASAKFLKKLYSIFKDWNLALAAYNSGPGNVTKAMRRSGEKNYWRIRSFLPRETAGYVPAFIAVNYIMNNYNYHNIIPKTPKITFYETDHIEIKETMKFNEIMKFTGISKDYLEFLNPSYKLNIIPKVKGRKYNLVLPKEYMDKFISNEDTLYSYVKVQRELDKDKLPNYKEGRTSFRYRVRSGDNLGSIARKYRTSVRSIKRWNGLRKNTIYIGQRLIIYPRKR